SPARPTTDWRKAFRSAAHARADAVDGGNAGTGSGAIDVHGTGAAKRHAAAELCSGHAEHVAQDPKQRRVAVNIDAVRVSIDFDCKSHDTFSSALLGPNLADLSP